MISHLAAVFGCTLLLLFIGHKVARVVGLTDTPNTRKRHVGAIPLVGGVVVGIVLLSELMLTSGGLPNQYLLAFSLSILLCLGMLDDKMDLPCAPRLFIQCVLALAMVFVADIKLASFGSAFGFGVEDLGWLSVPLTVLAVVGAINAFNMTDGIDGVLGTLSSITLSFLAYLFYLAGDIKHAQFCLVVVTALLAYLMFNLGFFGQKWRVFMGDSGSMIIGFIVVWLLLVASQHYTGKLTESEALYHWNDSGIKPMRPVTALWLIAVPLMDMVAIVFRRIKKGRSPFSPDRNHLHHIFQRIGFSPRQTLLLISGISVCLALFGVTGELLLVSESTMMVAFLVLFALYCLFLGKVWRISAFIRVRKRLAKQKQIGALALSKCNSKPTSANLEPETTTNDDRF